MPRILIDCAHIRLEGIPTGIPRVAANYIKWGAAWGQAHGYEVIPVVPYARGVGRANVFLCSDPSRAFVPLERARTIERLSALAKRSVNYLIERLRLFVFHLFMAIGLILPIRHAAAERISSTASTASASVSHFILAWIDRIHWKTLDVPIQAGDILFCPGYWHDVSPDIYRKLAERGCHIYFLVHDILPITHARYYPAPWRDEFKENVVASFSFVEAFFCVSDFTRTSLIELANRSTSKNIRTMLAHNGLDPLLEAGPGPRSKEFARLRALFPTFLISVGSIEPKKQHLYILEQLSDLWDKGYELPLFIIGRRGWMDHEIVDRIEMHPRFGERLFWLTDMTDEDLLLAYRQAKFLLFASEAEGFGLPVIEALSSQLPTLIYDTPVSREIAGGLGRYFDRRQSHLRDLLLNFSNDEAYARWKSELSSFSWPGWQERVESTFLQLHQEATKQPHAHPEAIAI